MDFMYRRTLTKVRMRTLKLSYVPGGVRVRLILVFVYLAGFLLRCGDVEPNPGPPKRQTLLSQSASDVEPTIGDVVKMLKDLDVKMTTVDKKMDSMSANIQEQLDKMQNDLAQATKENKELKEKVEKLEEKLDDMEGRSRRNNLIFHGIPHLQGKTETWSDCENSVKTVLKDDLGIDVEVEIERAHRLRGGHRSGQCTSPIIACFRSFKDKERVLAERRKLKENNPNVYINEDFSPRVREKRRLLQPFLREAKAAGKKAYLRFDSLIVEGKTHAYDPATQGLVERQGQR